MFKTSRHSQVLSTGIVALACSGLIAMSAGSASAEIARSTVPEDLAVTQLPHVKQVGKVNLQSGETISFVFKENNLAALEAQAQKGFERPLSVRQFTRTYGNTSGEIAALRAYLKHYHIWSKVLPGNVDVIANGSFGAIDHALGTNQSEYWAPAIKGSGGATTIPAQTFHANDSAITLPSAIASQVVAVLGLDSYTTELTNIRTAVAKLAVSKRTAATAHIETAHRQSAATSECLLMSGLPRDCNTARDFANEYGVSKLWKDGFKGQGQTLGIVTLASGDRSAPAYYWKYIEKISAGSRTVKYVNVDGGAGSTMLAAGSEETDLDIEQSGGVAPDANIIVYEAPNSSSGLVDALFTSASQNLAGSVSTSWGESEAVIDYLVAEGAASSGYEAATNEAFLELDAQGQAPFIASGDSGAFDAYSNLDDTAVSAGAESSSPYVTAVGGTTLAFKGRYTNPYGMNVPISVAKQRIWGWDYLWKPLARWYGSLYVAADEDISGSGGGFSTEEARPSYQDGVSGTNKYSAVTWLTPCFDAVQYGTTITITNPSCTNGDTIIVTAGSGYFSTGLPDDWDITSRPKVTTGTATGRATPDLAADADPETGYVLFAPSLTEERIPAMIYGGGGTSFAAPQMNGAAAVIDSALGKRSGFWNPAIYRLARTTYSPFTPLSTRGTSNDNLYYTGTPGDIFNAGAGLGVPNLNKLALDLKLGL